MEIDSELFQSLNTQLNREIFNSHSYRQLAALSDAESWDGFSKWLHHAADEELEHSRKIFDFLIDRNRVPTIETIEAPQVQASVNPINWLTEALDLEQANTRLIVDLYWVCFTAKDADAAIFLEWFVEEQRRSEREIQDLLLEAGRSDAAMKMVDEKLSK